ncbi:MAG: hypothetical protein OHK0037_29950 [Elainellaceae cyanobacterium]
MSHILALVVALGSFGLYMSAFFLPEVYRKNDFIWSGVGMFYALVLWVHAGRITGGVLLGQLASVALLGWLSWQLLESRRLLTPYDQQTRLPGSSRNFSDLLKLAAEELPGRLQTQFKALPQQASGWVNQVTSRVGKSPKLASKPVRSLPTARSKASPSSKPAEAPAAETPAAETPAAEISVISSPSARKPRLRPQTTPTSPLDSSATQKPATESSVTKQEPQAERSPVSPTDPASLPPSLVEHLEEFASAPELDSGAAVEADFAGAMVETAQDETAAENVAETAAEKAESEWVELATDSAITGGGETSLTLDEVLVELATGEPSDAVQTNVQSDVQEDELRSLNVQPLPTQPAEDAWTFDWEIAQSEPPNQPEPPEAFPDAEAFSDAGAIARDWQAEFDDDFGDDSDQEPKDAAENAVIVSIERLNLSAPLAEPVERLSGGAALPPQASAAEATEDLEPAKSDPTFADEDAEDSL